jgi:hypothetical protein
MASILSLDGVQKEIDAAIVELFPTGAAPSTVRRTASGG